MWSYATSTTMRRGGRWLRLRPRAPGVIVERARAVGLEERDELTPLRRREARADADVLEGAAVVEEAEQQRA